MLQASHLGNVFDDIGNFIGDAANSVVGAVGDVLSFGAKAVCGLVTSDAIKTGAGVAAMVPNPYAQAAAVGTKLIGGLCPGGGSTNSAQVPSKYPTGAIGAFDPSIARYRIAIPRGAALHGLGEAFPLIPEYRDEWAYAPMPQGAYASVHGALNRGNQDLARVSKGKLFWKYAKTASRPYRAVQGMGTQLQGVPTYAEAGTEATLPTGVTPVTLSVLEKQTGTLPWYKNPWVWAGIGGGAAALGGIGFLVVRKRRRR